MHQPTSICQCFRNILMYGMLFDAETDTTGNQLYNSLYLSMYGISHMKKLDRLIFKHS
jgi:hypothetical protein